MQCWLILFSFIVFQIKDISDTCYAYHTNNPNDASTFDDLLKQSVNLAIGDLVDSKVFF
jgi:hypothetical protein